MEPNKKSLLEKKKKEKKGELSTIVYLNFLNVP